ncbi:MAG: DUF1223 domain-containing protein [Lysobacterales bacterium]|nr:MAG: DUF1223 domain-containing protein [Xanthomonadales bacterium]
MRIRICLLVSLIFAPAVSTSAEALNLESPGPRVSLLELYTSEGCSSCPPADRWISKLRDDPRLWREVVPVAFHVDYWDYIGWRDRFASPDYGNRQRDYARSRRVSTVYTPGFVLAGEEWRSWFSRPTLILDSSVQAGKLKLSVNDQQATIAFSAPASVGGDLEVHVAVLGFDLTTDVRAGENGGHKLEHDFVVLGYHSQAMTREQSTHAADFTLPEMVAPSARRAIAAWVSKPGDPSPVQVVGGWLN